MLCLAEPSSPVSVYECVCARARLSLCLCLCVWLCEHMPNKSAETLCSLGAPTTGNLYRARAHNIQKVQFVWKVWLLCTVLKQVTLIGPGTFGRVVLRHGIVSHAQTQAWKCNVDMTCSKSNHWSLPSQLITTLVAVYEQNNSTAAKSSHSVLFKLCYNLVSTMLSNDKAMRVSFMMYFWHIFELIILSLMIIFLIGYQLSSVSPVSVICIIQHHSSSNEDWLSK